MTFLTRNQKSDFPNAWSRAFPSQRVFDAFFEDLWSDLPANVKAVEKAAGFKIKVDLKEDKEGYHIFADLPGVAEKDLEISLNDQALFIKGKKESERKEDSKDSWYIERSFGSFERAVTLPTEVAADKISASFKNGVLEIHLPKAPHTEERVRKIPLTSAM